MSPSPYPLPPINIPSNFVPKTPADYQMLSILHQIQNGSLPLIKVLVLKELFSFPFILLPESMRLGLYTFITSIPFISSIHLTNFEFAVWGLFILPLLTWAVLILLAVFIFKLIKNGPSVPSFILRLFDKTSEEKVFLELTFPSSTSRKAYATEQLYKFLNTRAKKQGMFRNFIHHKKIYSLEIVSDRNNGIRFILVVPKKEAEITHHILISFLPGLKVKEVPDYLSNLDEKLEDSSYGVVELKQNSDFILPLQDQKVLEEHDPISFLIGTMTKLDSGELLAFQIVTTPIIHSVQSKVEKRLRKIRLAIARGEPLTPLLQPTILGQLGDFLPVKILIFVFKGILLLFKGLLFLVVAGIVELTHGDSKGVTFFGGPKINIHMTHDPFEGELHNIVKEKVSQHLFETSIRILIVAENEMEFESRAESITSSLGQFTTSNQSLGTANSFLPNSFVQKRRLSYFKERSLTEGLLGGANPILSSSEMADLYHFPNTDLTKVEGLIKHKSADLPAPLSIKSLNNKLDVILGLNTYGGEATLVGLSDKQRKGHSYILGKTGSGKTTIIKGMTLQDIMSGKGVCFIDPHGDAAQELLEMIPETRIKDVIYVNPADSDFPIGLNILAPGTKFKNTDEAHEKITNCLMSVFQKITPPDKWGQRMEHILRNATLTVLELKPGVANTPYISLIAIQKLLTDQNYRREISPTIKDPILKQFWNQEIAHYGSRQLADAVSPLTNKLGEFVTSVRSRYILLQKESTINISEIMDQGKILVVNLSKGKLGEERSAFFGTLFTSLIQLATYAREEQKESERQDYYVYIDEFQNFATPHFIDIFSEARKYHVFFILSHQNIAQIKDTSILEGIATNADTLIVLKTGPSDERFILPYMEPEVEKGAIVNLDPHHFFIKTTADNSEDAFSGETVPVSGDKNKETAEKIILNTRVKYAKHKTEVEKEIQQLFAIEPERKTKPTRKTKEKSNGVKSNGIKTNGQYKTNGHAKYPQIVMAKKIRKTSKAKSSILPPRARARISNI